jgi:uncharacterized protein (TIGR02271 family)
MISADQVRQVIGSTAYGSDGQKIGKVGQVYFDEATDQPEWVTVNTGLFGTNESFVPLERATFDGDRLTVPHIKDKVKGAPNVGDDGYLSPEEERTLYDYYRPGWEDYVAPSTGTHDSTVTHDTTVPSGTSVAEQPSPSGQPTDDAITRSEEQLHVGTQSQVAGRARLRRWVDTEYVDVTVPVRREKAVLETEHDDASPGHAVSPDEGREVILSEERPVVSTTVHPVQQVRIGTETVTEEETVTEQVRKERIDIEGVDDDGRAG